MAKQPTPTSTMRYDPAAVPKGSTMLEQYPELANYTAFAQHGAGENDRYARFAILYTAPDSPLRDWPLDDKKRECFKQAGIEASDPRRAAIETWQDEGARAMANQYIKRLNDIDYACWWHFLHGLYDSLEQVSSPLDASELEANKEGQAFVLRHKLITEINTQRKEVKQIARELFMGDEELREQSQQAVLADTGRVERRSAGQTFVPKKP